MEVLFVEADFFLNLGLSGFYGWWSFNELGFDQNFAYDFGLGVHEFEPVREIARFSHLLYLYLGEPKQVGVLNERALRVGEGRGTRAGLVVDKTPFSAFWNFAVGRHVHGRSTQESQGNCVVKT